MNSTQTLSAVKKILNAFIETISEAGTQGAPIGPMYAAVMDKMTLQTFNAVIDALVQTGKIKRTGDVLFSC